MAAFLFWNTNKKQLVQQVSALAQEHGVDVLVLAECAMPEAALLEGLNPPGHVAYSSVYDPSFRFSVFTKFPRAAFRAVASPPRATIYELTPPAGTSVLLVLVHLPSKLRRSDRGQESMSRKLASAIAEAEERVGHARTVVFGDLNMNPFEPGLVEADHLHAVMSRHVAAKGSRQVDGTRYRFLYNPMWSLLGDESPGPPGTYYYPRGGNLTYYWNMLDQVLVRPDLLPLFGVGKVRVLTTAGDVPLVSEQQIPVHCDHLPVLFQIGIEGEDV